MKYEHKALMKQQRLRKTKVLAGKNVPLALHPPQITHQITDDLATSAFLQRF
jgi:hypothetical protein